MIFWLTVGYFDDTGRNIVILYYASAPVDNIVFEGARRLHCRLFGRPRGVRLFSGCAADGVEVSRDAAGDDDDGAAEDATLFRAGRRGLKRLPFCFRHAAAQARFILMKRDAL